VTTEPPEHLARFETQTPPDAAVAELRAMSKRGKLAGFREDDARTVRADAHGTPFDGDLILTIEPTQAGSRVEARTRLRQRMPAAFVLIILATIWPGLPLAEGFLLTFRWYERLVSGAFDTWMWYLPLTVLPAPWAIAKAIKRSRASSRDHALETIARIRATLDGT